MLDKKLVKNLKNILKEYENPNFIDPDSGYRNLLDICKSILIGADYKVVDPFKFSLRNIKRPYDLVSLFYGLLADKYPDKLNLGANFYSKQNLKIASSFLKSRMNSKSVSKKTALLECAEIIKTLVDNLEIIGIDLTNLSFSIFGQDSLAWVTNRAVAILNNDHTLKSETQADKLVDLYINKVRDEIKLGYDFDELNIILQ
jgi:hypothetical protein